MVDRTGVSECPSDLQRFPARRDRVKTLIYFKDGVLSLLHSLAWVSLLSMVRNSRLTCFPVHEATDKPCVEHGCYKVFDEEDLNHWPSQVVVLVNKTLSSEEKSVSSFVLNSSQIHISQALLMSGCFEIKTQYHLTREDWNTERTKN